MNFFKPFGAGARPRPYASSRHRLKHGLTAALLRDDPMSLARPLSDDVLSDMPAEARREIRDRHEGGQA